MKKFNIEMADLNILLYLSIIVLNDMMQFFTGQ